MKKLLLISAVLLGGCTSTPDHPLAPFRGDVLYYRNDASGQKAAKQVAEIYGGRQKVILVDQELPEASHPIPISRPAPQYPYDMWQKRLGGDVTVDFIIDETGHVFDAAVTDTTNPAFNTEALAAVKKWTFKPASRGGMNIRIRLQIPLTFAVTQ